MVKAFFFEQLILDIYSYLVSIPLLSPVTVPHRCIKLHPHPFLPKLGGGFHGGIVTSRNFPWSRSVTYLCKKWYQEWQTYFAHVIIRISFQFNMNTTRQERTEALSSVTFDLNADALIREAFVAIFPVGANDNFLVLKRPWAKKVSLKKWIGLKLILFFRAGSFSSRIIKTWTNDESKLFGFRTQFWKIWPKLSPLL